MTGWPFVGREEAVDHVTGLLQDPDVAAVLLEGPAGIGQSAIAAHVATTLAATSGASVVKLRGPDPPARFDVIDPGQGLWPNAGPGRVRRHYCRYARLPAFRS